MKHLRSWRGLLWWVLLHRSGARNLPLYQRLPERLALWLMGLCSVPPTPNDIAWAKTEIDRYIREKYGKV